MNLCNPNFFESLEQLEAKRTRVEQERSRLQTKDEPRHERVVCSRGKSSCVEINVLQYPSLYFHIYVFTVTTCLYDGYWIRDRKSMGLRSCHSPLTDHIRNAKRCETIFINSRKIIYAKAITVVRKTLLAAPCRETESVVFVPRQTISSADET